MKQRMNRIKSFVMASTIVLTSFFCALFYGNNTYAIEFVSSLVPTGHEWTTGTDLRCVLSKSDGTSTVVISANSSNQCNLTGTFGSSYVGGVYVNGFYKLNKIDIVKGNYYVVDIMYQQGVNGTSLVTWSLNVPSYFSIVGYKQQYDDRMIPNYTDGLTFIQKWQSSGYSLILRANETGTKEFLVGSKTNSNQTYINYAQGFLSVGTIVEYSYASDNASQEMNDKDNKDREDIENQQNQSSSDSNSSQDDAENTGTTLLSAFSSFVGALTNASPSNCRINMDMGNLDLGEVDFCSLSPPPVFQTIASVLLIAFVVPLSIATATKVINLFRSFQ